MKILLIEDDDVLAEVLVNTLTAEHYAVDVATDGQMGWELASSFVYDLILLDVMLPKLDGINLCRRLRSQGNQTPILLLTSQDTSSSKVLGLDAGADDYMTKPFDKPELLARMRALQRRESVTLLPILSWENLSLNPSTREVTYQNEPIYLRPREYALLELFLRNPHRVFSRSVIIDHLWSFEGTPSEETVTAHIKGLRRHLKTAGLSHDPIETVYGIGYRLRSESPTQEGLSLQAAQQANVKTTAVWERTKQRLSSRIALIEQATSAGLADTLADELRQQAIKEAHKLAGSLGMFNFDEGSQLAREAELALQNWPQLPSQQRTQLADVVDELQRSVRQALQSEASTLFYPGIPATPVSTHAPYLLVISSDGAFQEALAAAAASSAKDWAVQAEADVLAAHALLRSRRPDVVLLDLSSLSSGQTTTRLHPDTVAFLGELLTLSPTVPVLLRTDPESLLDRVKVARLGGRGFISPTLPAAAVIETVLNLWRRSRPLAATVLLVDDDPQILEAMRQLLEPWGLTLFTLDDPRQFWDVLNRAQPDLLVLDVEMPHLDGLSLCQVVRSDLNWGHMPILFLTAHTDTNTKHQVFEAGADDYVSKPIVGPEVVTRILNRLERSRLSQSHSEMDILTGLSNRRHTAQSITQLLELARQHHQHLCLAALKVDHLETINCLYGYELGDTILTQLGTQLRQAFVGDDVVGRWGGRIFVVAMYGMGMQEGVCRLSNVLEDFRQVALPAEPQSEVSQVSFSAGVVTYPQVADASLEDGPGGDCSTLIAAAMAVLTGAREGHILST